jgi:hypothetical protein
LTGQTGALPAARLLSSTPDQTIIDLAALIAQPSSLQQQTLGLSSVSGAPARLSSATSDRTIIELAAELFAHPSLLQQPETLGLLSSVSSPYGLSSSTITSLQDAGANTAAAAAGGGGQRPSSSSAITIEELRQMLSRSRRPIPLQELRGMLDSADLSRPSGLGQDK